MKRYTQETGGNMAEYGEGEWVRYDELFPALNCSAPNYPEFLNGFIECVNGVELKGWVHDFEEGGVHKTYLNAKDCREVARQFIAAAERLEQNEERTPTR